MSSTLNKRLKLTEEFIQPDNYITIQTFPRRRATLVAEGIPFTFKVIGKSGVYISVREADLPKLYAAEKHIPKESFYS